MVSLKCQEMSGAKSNGKPQFIRNYEPVVPGPGARAGGVGRARAARAGRRDECPDRSREQLNRCSI